MSTQNYLAINRPFLYAYGMEISPVGTSNITQINVSSGQVRDSNDVMDLCIGVIPESGPTTVAPVLVDTTKNGIGGLDQGTITANAFYSVYAIGDSSYNRSTSAILSLQSNSSPLMPAGYDSFRLIGYIAINASSHIVNFIQDGLGTDRRIDYIDAALILSGGSSTSPLYASCANFVPSGFPGVAMVVDVFSTVATAGDSVNINNDTPVVNPLAAMEFDTYVPVTAFNQIGTPVVQWYASASGASISMDIMNYIFSI